MKFKKNLLLLLVLSSTLISFSQNGAISGKIIDVQTQDGVIGANVVIKGTTQGTATDIEGNYKITNVAPGTYTIVVTNIAYEGKQIENVKVEAGKTTNLNVAMNFNSKALNEIEIVDFKKADTEASLIVEMKEAKQIVSGISAQQIGKTLDRDASQVVRRIPGVLVTGSFINIRGLNQRYNNVMLHNTFAPSMEADIKSFSFDIIPSSQIDKIIIYKSPTPENPGEWAGGLVKIYTRSVPDSNFWDVSYTTSFRNGTTFEDFYHQENGPFWWTGIDNGFHSLPDNFPSNLRSNNLTSEQIEEAGRSLRNNWVAKKTMAMPDQRFSILKGTRIKKDKVLIGNITALNYSNTYSTFDVERSDFNAFDLVNKQSSVIYTFNDAQYNRNIRTGLLHNWAFNFNNKHIIEFKNLFNYNMGTQYILRTGRDFEFNYSPMNHSFDHIYRGIYSGQLMGRHDLVKDKTSIDWVVGYGNSYRNQPDYKRYRSDLDEETGKTTLYIPVGQAATYFMGRFYSEMKENIITGSVNFNQKLGFKNSNFKPTVSTGFFSEYKDRVFVARNLGYVRTTNMTQEKLDNLLNGGITNLFDPRNIDNATGIRLDEQTNPNDSYEATNFLMAGYAALNLPFTGRIALNGGVRLENNIQTLTSSFTNGTPVNVVNPILSVLPSANLTFNINERMLVRTSYGMSLNRPEFRELAPFGFYDFNFNFTNRGNPELKTPIIHNYDARWELYPGIGEVISFAAFHKTFINPIEVTFVPGAGSGGAKNFTYENAERAFSRGFEIEFRKSMNNVFSNKILKRFGTAINASIIQSIVELGEDVAIGQSNRRPLQGQAPYLVNGGIFYDDIDNGLMLNLQYNIIGKRILIIGFEGYPDIYEMPRHALDISFSKNVGKNLSINGGIADIINMPMLLLQDGNEDGIFDRDRDQVIQKFRPGQVVSLGARYRF